MAIYYWKFSVTCSFYFLCLILLSNATSLPGVQYYEYITPDSTSTSLANLDLRFIDNDVKHLVRSRRQSSKTVCDNQGKVTSNGTSLNTQVCTDGNNLSNSKVNSGNLASDNEKGQDVPLGVPSGNKLLKDAAVQPAASTSTSKPAASSSSPSFGSTHTVPDNGLIVSADFDPHVSDAQDLPGTLSDLLNKNKDLDISVNQFSDDITNSSLYKSDNTTKDLKLMKDTHVYYNSTFIVDEKIGQHYWVDMSDQNNVKIHNMLSQSHRRAATVQLNFQFPFYGHLVNNVTIATGGFLFTGDHIHTWLAATQYIAPLMANFDTRLSNYSFVKFRDNGTAFTVLWENVQLKDTPNFGNFTFEATLHQNGDIVFVYKNIPVIVEQIKDDNHPVKVGLSDAYIIDRTIFFVKRKTIYEYHRVNFSKEDIRNWTVIYLHALPTCRDMKDCDSCIHGNAVLECKWCPSVDRCSTGLDRARQEWLAHECDKVSAIQCNEPPPPPHAHKAAEPSVIISKQDGVHSDKSRTMVGTSGVVSMLLIFTSIAATAFLVLYAYRNPHSTPGQLLIRYRPSQWRWRRGEARYTAATIHM